jgi:hypothetical protein
MRVLTINELLRPTRIELCDLAHAAVGKTLAFSLSHESPKPGASCLRSSDKEIDIGLSVSLQPSAQ